MPKKELNKILVTETNYKFGDRVVRSPQWVTGNGIVKNPNTKGTISKVHGMKGCIIVTWDDAGTYGHRIGYDNIYELYFDNDSLTNCLINRIGHMLIRKKH